VLVFGAIHLKRQQKDKGKNNHEPKQPSIAHHPYFFSRYEFIARRVYIASARPSPTEVVAPSTAVPTEAVQDLEPISQADLVDATWQWVASRQPLSAPTQMVPDPERYTLNFNEDGSLFVQADCNTSRGAYELLGSTLTLNQGITTLALCARESKYDLYSSLFERVTGVGNLEGQLVLLLDDGAAAMSFANAGEAPVETAPPTIEGDPAAVLGPPTGVENFDNANNWTTFDGECFSSEITGGQIVMTAKGVPQSSCWEVSWPQLDNFYIETSQVMPQTCDPQDRFGLLFRAPDNYRGYLYGFDCGGGYSLTIWDGQQTTTLVEPTGQPLPVTPPPLLPSTVNFPVPPAYAPQVVMREPAMVRSGPTLEFPVMGVAPNGTRAEVIGLHDSYREKHNLIALIMVVLIVSVVFLVIVDLDRS
jgi:heat shock protein HslJ